MGYRRNSAEGGTDGNPVTISGSGGASGDQFTILLLNNANVPGGTTALKYETNSATLGSVGFLLTPNTLPSYVRSDIGDLQDRYACSVEFTYLGNPSADWDIMSWFDGSTLRGNARVHTNGEISITQGSTYWAASRSVGVSFVTGDDYMVEVIHQRETGGGGNGVRAIRVTNLTTSTVTYTYTNSTQATSTGYISRFRHITTTTSNYAVDVPFDEAGWGDLAAGWPGRRVTSSPPVINIAQPSQNIVDLRASTIGDDSTELTYVDPVHVSGPVLAWSELTTGIWLFERDSTDSVYEFEVTQDDLQADTDTATIVASSSTTVNQNAPLRALNTPPAAVWG